MIVQFNTKTLIMTLTLLTAIINILFFENKLISLIYVSFEVGLLCYFWLKNKYSTFLGFYMIFCCLSLEYGDELYSQFFYGFKQTEIMGINMGALILIPPTVTCLVHLKYRFLKKCSPTFYKFINYIIIICVLSVFFSLVMCVTNDNNSIYGIKEILQEFYLKYFQLFCIGVLFIHELQNDKIREFKNIEIYFEYVLFGVVFCQVISFLTGTKGQYGGVSTLVVPSTIRWTPILLLIPHYKKNKRLKYYFAGIVSMIFTLAFNATGKTILVYLLIPIIYLVIFIKKKLWSKFCIWIACVPVVLVTGLLLIQRFSSFSKLFNSKINQVISLVMMLIGKTSIHLGSSSPSARLYEFLNITLEYVKKPWYIFAGKGLIGSYLNHVEVAFIKGGYSDIENITGVYYRMHETVNRLYLSNGLIGLYFIYWIIKITIKNIQKSPWLLLGTYWFLISFGHSITMSAIGIPCLIYGLIMIDEEKLYEKKDWINNISKN